jgi:hypothetical protein
MESPFEKNGPADERVSPVPDAAQPLGELEGSFGFGAGRRAASPAVAIAPVPLLSSERVLSEADVEQSATTVRRRLRPPA